MQDTPTHDDLCEQAAVVYLDSYMREVAHDPDTALTALATLHRVILTFMTVCFSTELMTRLAQHQVTLAAKFTEREPLMTADINQTVLTTAETDATRQGK